MTQVIAIIALVIFALVMIIIGASAGKSTGTMDGFLLGGRKIGAWMSAFAYGTTYFSAVIFIGYAGKFGWDIGFAAIWIGLGNALLGCLLAWKVLGRRTRRMTHTLSARTMPEFFAARYQDKGMRVFSALIIFIFLVPYAAGVYKGLGSLFGTIFPNVADAFFGLSASTVCMIIVAVLTAIYLLWGGYKATATVDFVQGIIMIVGVIVMAVAIVNNPNVGGVSNAVETLKNNQTNTTLVSIFGGSNWKFLLTNILLTSFGTWALPQMVHKFYAIKGESSIRKGMIVSTGFALIIGCGAYFVGTFGRFFVPASATGAPDLASGYDGVVPAMLTGAFGSSVWGNVLLSVILLLVLSASMSTLSSLVLSSSSSISVDLLETYKKEVDTKKQVLFTRVLCLLFISLSVLFASFNFAIIVSIMSYSWGMVSGCFIGPYVWGLYSRKITRAGAWAGMIGGFVTIVSMTLYNTLSSPAMTDGLYAAFKAASANSPLYGVTAMAVSMVIVPLVSSFTRKLDEGHVKYVFSTTQEEVSA